MDLRSAIAIARKGTVAIGHFNVAETSVLRAVFSAAQKVSADVGMKIPVIIGTSEGEREFLGPTQTAALIRSLREQHDYPIFLNADHTHSLEKAEEAARAGYDAILFDGAKLPFEENVQQTRTVVERVKAIDPRILVEGELGYIGSSSALLREIPVGAAITEEMMTKPEEAQRFVQETGVDLFAPAVGNLHGMLVNMPNPSLHIERITDIARVISVPLVLHGGSGSRDDEFTASIRAGISVIHISTELRVAWRNALAASLAGQPDEIAPYRLLSPAVSAVAAVVDNRIRLFARL